MNIKKILFATDFSTTSEAALKYATALARDSGAMLLIVHAEEPMPPLVAGEVYMLMSTFPNPELQILLDKVVPSDDSVRCEHRLLTGMPADEIVRFAEEENVDLIVMGTHGRTGLRRLLLGSTAEAVLRRAPCPVLTFKQTDHVPAEVG